MSLFIVFGIYCVLLCVLYIDLGGQVLLFFCFCFILVFVLLFYLFMWLYFVLYFNLLELKFSDYLCIELFFVFVNQKNVLNEFWFSVELCWMGKEISGKFKK